MSSARTQKIRATGVRDSGELPQRLIRQAAKRAASFATAVVIDQATGQRYSQILGSIAIVISILAVWPSVRTLSIPLSVYAGV